MWRKMFCWRQGSELVGDNRNVTVTGFQSRSSSLNSYSILVLINLIHKMASK